MGSSVRGLVAFILPALLAAPAARAQDSAPSYQQPRGNRMPPVPRTDFQPLPARFSFNTDATALLHRLWQESAASQREHVACIVGEVEEEKVRVTSVMLLDVAGADSLGVSAQGSIDACGPPDWLGTVHTHIARYDGQHPYPNFSGADRGVMFMWWQRWQVDGLFCVLYSEREAFCEVSGASGLSHMSRGPY
jgi:hypothetical protein